MSLLLERRAVTYGMGFEESHLDFDLSIEDKEIAEVLDEEHEETTKTLEFCRRRLPLPRSIAVSTEGHFYRFPGHNRSFCYALTRSDAFLESPVFVFKGCEPLISDFPEMLEWMGQAPLRKSNRVMTDHFPLSEGKVPGVLSLKEAMREARLALEIQRRHLKHYGALATIPTPLLVHKLSESRINECGSRLRDRLSNAAYERIEPVLAQGLAIYAYYYPAPPIRANFRGGVVSSKLSQYVESRFREEDAIRGWVRLMTRLLYLGFLPYSVLNEGLGACMDFGNATLDGGFCDPDSIVPVSHEMEDEFYRDGLVQSLLVLQNTVQLMLGMSDNQALYSSADGFVCLRYLLNLVEEAFESEARVGLQMDHRVLKSLSPRSLADLRACTLKRNRFATYAQFSKHRAMPVKSR